jgi:hypothetical protein
MLHIYNIQCVLWCNENQQWDASLLAAVNSAIEHPSSFILPGVYFGHLLLISAGCPTV